MSGKCHGEVNAAHNVLLQLLDEICPLFFRESRVLQLVPHAFLIICQEVEPCGVGRWSVTAGRRAYRLLGIYSVVAYHYTSSGTVSSGVVLPRGISRLLHRRVQQGLDFLAS